MSSPDLLTADTRPRERFSLFWLIPIAALIIAVSLAYNAWQNKGLTITLSFESAEGLEAGKTPIKYKNVEIGKVLQIHLDPISSRVEVVASIERRLAAYLNTHTQFWVVRPRITGVQISGFSTLLSGGYIAVDPGKNGDPIRSFTGLEEPPVVTLDTEGRYYLLKAETLGSLEVGAPVYYRQIPVGQVVGYGFDASGSAVDIRIFINAPHHRQVQQHTRFYNAGGVDLRMDTAGVQVRTESLISLFMGGIAFETPVNLGESTPAPEGHLFKLYADKEGISQPGLKKETYYVLFFDESIHGLSVGAPVELNGIQVGEVIDYRLEFDPESLAFQIPVLIGIDQSRINLPQDSRPPGPDLQIMDTLVKKGFRAQLRSGMLLTGQLYIALGMFPNAAPATVNRRGRYPVFPTIPTTEQEILTRLTRFLDTLENLPVSEIAEDTKLTLSAVRKWVTGQQMDAFVDEMKTIIGEVKTSTSQVNEQLIPGILHTVDSADTALDQLKATLKSIEGTVGQDAELIRELNQSLIEIQKAGRSIRELSDYVNRHPESLLFGKEPAP